MLLITWNIQWARGADGVVDPARVIRDCREMGDFDVLCFQEVARNFPALPGAKGMDLFHELAALAVGYTPIEGIAVDVAANDGKRAQFGQLILTRRPVLQVFRHPLPWPGDPGKASMPRLALEIVIGGGRAPLRVTTTHLEYYSARQRRAQVERLRELHAEAVSHADDASGAPDKDGPFAPLPRPPASVLTGDFNLPPEDALHERMQAPIADGVPAYRDAWRLQHPNIPHPPTLGVHDKQQWPGEPYCCDYIFVSEDLADRVEEVAVDSSSQASDHQPVLLKLAG